MTELKCHHLNSDFYFLSLYLRYLLIMKDKNTNFKEKKTHKHDRKPVIHIMMANKETDTYQELPEIMNYRSCGLAFPSFLPKVLTVCDHEEMLDNF